MILEILLAIPVSDKTFFYKENLLEKTKPKVGQIVKVKFRNKKQIGIVFKIPQQKNPCKRSNRFAIEHHMITSVPEEKKHGTVART